MAYLIESMLARGYVGCPANRKFGQNNSHDVSMYTLGVSAAHEPHLIIGNWGNCSRHHKHFGNGLRNTLTHTNATALYLRFL